MPAKFYQMTNSSLPVFFLRGGGRYFIKTDYSSSWSIKTSAFTSNSQTVQPCSTPPTYNQLTKWSYDTDTTYINGGKIYTGTVTALQIAAKAITADKLNVSSLSAISANLGTVSAGSITSNTTINVTTDLRVGNNIYINQNVNSIKYIKFNENNYIMNMYTNSINYLRIVSNLRVSMVFEKTGSTSAFVNASSDGAYLSCGGNQIIASSGGNKITGNTNVDGSISANAISIGGYLLSDFNNGLSLGYGGYAAGYKTHIWGDYIQFKCKGGSIDYYGKYIDGNWSSGYFAPAQNGTALGSSSSGKRWYRLYSSNASSESSDERLKTNIVDLDDRYIEFYEMLRPIAYNWKTNTNANKEAGLIAQEVQKAMHECCISNKEFGIVDDSGDYLSIIYRNLSILNLKYAQTKSKEVSIKLSNHDNEISRLKNEITQLKQELKNTKDKLDAFIQGNYEIREVAS